MQNMSSILKDERNARIKKGIFVFPGKTIKYVVIDQFLCMVACCAFGTDACHWMFSKRSAWFKDINMANCCKSLLQSSEGKNW